MNRIRSQGLLSARRADTPSDPQAFYRGPEGSTTGNLSLGTG
jgi:hypothetical protein